MAKVAELELAFWVRCTELTAAVAFVEFAALCYRV